MEHGNEKCQCHDCEQARWKSSLQGQIEAAMKPVGGQAREPEQIAHEWLQEEWPLHCAISDKFTIDDVVDALTAYAAHRREAEQRELAEVKAERDRLNQWRDSVSSAIKTIPEFSSGQWSGDKEGWGFHFEMVNFVRREREAAEASLRSAKADALREAADAMQDNN